MTAARRCQAQVAILMATYNSAAYTAEQIASISRQSFRDWHLFVQDDCSTDATPQVIERSRLQDPGRITVLRTSANLGAKANFASLLAGVTARYLMFCDGDDVWEGDKIERTLNLLKRYEAVFGVDKPLLVHTDLMVVDRDLQPIASSFWRMQGNDPRASLRFNRNLVGSPAAGCTMLLNRPLRDRSVPIPAAAIMHDWWLLIVASAFGNVIYLNRTTVRYRQHGANVVGALDWGPWAMARSFLGLLGGRTALQRSIDRTVLQGRALLERFGHDLTPRQRRLVAGLAWPARDRLQRLGHLLAGHLYKHGFARTFGFVVHFCFLSPRYPHQPSAGGVPQPSARSRAGGAPGLMGGRQLRSAAQDQDRP